MGQRSAKQMVMSTTLMNSFVCVGDLPRTLAGDKSLSAPETCNWPQMFVEEFSKYLQLKVVIVQNVYKATHLRWGTFQKFFKQTLSDQGSILPRGERFRQYFTYYQISSAVSEC